MRWGNLIFFILSWYPTSFTWQNKKIIGFSLKFLVHCKTTKKIGIWFIYIRDLISFSLILLVCLFVTRREKDLWWSTVHVHHPHHFNYFIWWWWCGGWLLGSTLVPVPCSYFYFLGTPASNHPCSLVKNDISSIVSCMLQCMMIIIAIMINNISFKKNDKQQINREEDPIMAARLAAFPSRKKIENSVLYLVLSSRNIYFFSLLRWECIVLFSKCW